MIAKDFMTLTDQMIEKWKVVKAVTGNGNVIIAKPEINRMQKSKGGIIVPTSAADLVKKRAGFGRIISIPLGQGMQPGDMPLNVGDFAFFTFASENPLYREAISEILNLEIPSEFLTFTSDNEIICTIPSEYVCVMDSLKDSRIVLSAAA